MTRARKNCKAAGTRREHDVKRRLEADGWVVRRSPASLGEDDLLAMRAGRRPRLVQVKANHGSPYMNFRGPEREQLLAAAAAVDAEAWLVHWPPNGQECWIASADWPPVRARRMAIG